jgi:hypothetical protein
MTLLQQYIYSLSEPITFVDDTSIIITSKNVDEYCIKSNIVLPHVLKWFTDIKLALKLDKTNIIKFIMNNSPKYVLHIGYKEEYTEISYYNADLQTDNHLNWKIK